MITVKSVLSFLVLFFCMALGIAADAVALPAAVPPSAAVAAPRFEFVHEARVKLGTPIRTGVYNGHERGMMQLPGGAFEGPRMRGKVLPSSHDWPEYLGNGVRVTEAAYVFQTDEGRHLFVRVQGYRYDKANMNGLLGESEQVDPPSNALRVMVQITAPDNSPHAWMNHNLFVGVAGPLVPGPEPMTTLPVYRVL